MCVSLTARGVLITIDFVTNGFKEATNSIVVYMQAIRIPRGTTLFQQLPEQYLDQPLLAILRSLSHQP